MQERCAQHLILGLLGTCIAIHTNQRKEPAFVLWVPLPMFAFHAGLVGAAYAFLQAGVGALKRVLPTHDEGRSMPSH